MDRKLLDLLVCPTTRQPVQRLEADALASLNAAAAAGTLRKGDGSVQPLQGLAGGRTTEQVEQLAIHGSLVGGASGPVAGARYSRPAREGGAAGHGAGR